MNKDSCCFLTSHRYLHFVIRCWIRYKQHRYWLNNVHLSRFSSKLCCNVFCVRLINWEFSILMRSFVLLFFEAMLYCLLIFFGELRIQLLMRSFFLLFFEAMLYYLLILFGELRIQLLMIDTFIVLSCCFSKLWCKCLLGLFGNNFRLLVSGFPIDMLCSGERLTMISFTQPNPTWLFL